MDSNSVSLTTLEAAALLVVSHPYLIGLLEKGDIPSWIEGGELRVSRDELVAYKTRIDAARRKTLDKLAEEAQKLNMGY